MTDTSGATEAMPEPTYDVVINEEEQYSIWATGQDVPAGWRAIGQRGTKEECLSYIDRVWTDMRPRSLREHMAANVDATPQEVTPDPTPPLVERLAHDQPVEASLRPERTVAALSEAIDNGYVFVRFTETRGGTELGVRIDPQATDISGADFAAARGEVVIVGDLTLDFEPVRCFARLDLASLSGQGRLESSQAAGAP